MKSLFGPLGDQLCRPERVFWKLDFMENSSRMRRCVRRNYRGSDHFGVAANFEDLVQRNNDQGKVPVLAAEVISMDVVNGDYDHAEADNIDGGTGTYNTKQSGENPPRLSGTDENKHPSSEFNDPPLANNQNLETTSAVAPGYIPSDVDDRIIFELQSSVVRPLRVIRQTFQVTAKRINFIVDTIENYVGDGTESCHSKVQEKDRSWLISSLHQIHSRRYLLRKSALELFMVDLSNYFFDFGSTEGRRNAYRAIVNLRPPHLNNIYLATQRPKQLLKRTQLIERWARWEISNFEYLMQLNTLPGRSYNDITQYPVFPWILFYYDSKSLDLNNSSSYRNLSKPVGALNPDRLKKFQERYSSFDDPVIPKFHYGSHYFSAGTEEDIEKYSEDGTPIKRFRRKARIVHSDNIAGRRFWNSHQSLVKEMVNPDYIKSFLFESKLMPSTWIVIRIDGCHFHRFCDVHDFEKPNDEQALNLMNSCAVNVLQEFKDVVFAYGVSDEYSFILEKDSKFHQRKASYIVSAIVSLFSTTYVMNWNSFFPQKGLKCTPYFDGRAVSYPSVEILRDYLSWRQVDCHINNQYNTCFWALVKSGKSKSDAQRILKGTQTREKNELLAKFSIDYNNLPVIFRHGSSVFRDLAQQENGTVKSYGDEVFVQHCSIIEDMFWKAHPNILGYRQDQK